MDYNIIDLYDLKQLILELESYDDYFREKIQETKSQVITYLSNGLTDSAILFELTNNIRNIWLTHTSSISCRSFRSPPISVANKFIKGITYEYERLIESDFLEKKLQNYRTKVSRWESEHLLFSSGMSAITTIINSIIFMKPEDICKIDIAFCGAYFETKHYLEIISSENVHLDVCGDVLDFKKFMHKDSSGIKIIFIEPVFYDSNLTTFDLINFLAILKNYPTVNPLFVIFDTSLVGNRIPFSEILTAFISKPETIFIQINSGLKLEQQGLELSNLGIASIFLHQKVSKSISNYFVMAIKRLRGLQGLNLRTTEMMALNTPFVFDLEKTNSFMDKIFENNKFLAESLFNHMNFGTISHPYISNPSGRIFEWNVSPFVIIKIPNFSDYRVIITIIQYECKLRNIVFIFGNSFGFRHHRLEYITPNINDETSSFMKIACGYETTGLNEIINILKKIFTFQTIDELFEEYSFLLN